jgi:autotransporter-associated beta strand protein
LALLGVLLALAAAALTPTPALADTKTWMGDFVIGGQFWTIPGNWAGGVAPVAGDDLVFPANAIRHTTNNDYPAGTKFNSITISDSGYTLNGNAVRIALSQAITASYATGSSRINLPIDGDDTHIVVTNSGATLVFGGTLGNASGFEKFGQGTAVLLGTGSATGWFIHEGILNVQNGEALGANDVEIFATLQVQGGISLPNPMLSDVGGVIESVSGSNTLTGGVALTNNSTVSADAGATLTISANTVRLNTSSLTVTGAGTTAIASPIQGTGGVTKTGTGVLALSGTNTYTGPTTVSTGTLLVTGSQTSSSVTVASGATLGGTGTTGPVTVNGAISPGVGGPGVLHTGNAVLNGGSTFAVDLNGTAVGSGYDQLFSAGAVTLSAPTLAVSVGFSSTLGNVFVILQSTMGLAGTFAGLPDGATLATGGRTFQINYTANAVTLTDVGIGATSTPTPAPTVTPTPTSTVTPTPTAIISPTATSCILGDINCDGIVDIRDYGIWRQNFGQTNCGNPADLDGNCIVDIRDYGIWRANFGHTAGAAARTPTPVAAPRSGAATPTPTRAPAGGGPGSAWAGIRQAAQALGAIWPAERLARLATMMQ